jgi:hypothetical protein
MGGPRGALAILLAVGDCLLGVGDCLLGVGDCLLGVGDCRLGVGDCRRVDLSAPGRASRTGPSGEAEAPPFPPPPAAS